MRARILTLLLALVSPPAADAASESGRVVRVFDGDTVEWLHAGMRQRVRIEGIDAPESGQPWAREARETLAALCRDQPAIIEGEHQDRHGRRLGRLYCGGIDVAAELIRQGLAWTYSGPGPADPALLALEAQARRAGRGLWSEPNPLPPWEFRQASRHGLAPAAPPLSGGVRGNRNSMIYHLPHCESFDAISPRNRVVFPSEEAALAAGYRRARNCR